MSRNHKVVGLISTMSPDKTWPQEFIDRVVKNHSVIKAAVEKMGFEVLDEGPITREYRDMYEAGTKLKARGINALIIYVGTWTYVNAATAAALQADVPVIVWGDATPNSAGLVGSCITHGGMKVYGIHTHHVYGLFDDAQTLEKVKLYLTGACAAKGLRGQIFGIAGARCMGMVTAVCDSNEWRQKFGIDVDGWDQFEIIDKAESRPDDEAKRFLEWMKKTFGPILAKEEVMLKQIKMYLALKDLIAERQYDFLAVKCLPELPAIHTTFCIAHAMLNDRSDAFGEKESFVCSCEDDVNGALTMQIMKLLTGGPVMFTDLLLYDPGNHIITTCNCGSQPTDFAPTKKDVHWQTECLHEFQWRYGGTSPQYIAKAGEITMARLGKLQDEYVMMITGGEVVSMPREKLKESFLYERPHAFIRPRCTMDELVENVLANHIHFVYGDCEAALLETCAILGIRPIVV